MKNLDIKKLKYIILGVVFFATVVFVFIFEGYTKDSSNYEMMEDATYPTVIMVTDQGRLFNQLHGYAYEMDIKQMNEVITPMPANKKVPALIRTYGADISQISYKVKSITTNDLIEETVVKDYVVEGQNIDVVFNIKNLVENNVEYMLEICLTTKDNHRIFYYTKIVAGVYSGINEKLDFVTEFNSCVYDKSKLNNIVAWIEPKSGADNSNYGYANINSSLSHIGWGDLNPTVESELIPKIHEISSEIASIGLDYVAAFTADDNSHFSCNVDEFYRVRITSRGSYLLNYERKADAVFSSANDVNSNRITIGMRSGDVIQNMTSADGRYILFVSDGNLWSFNQEKREFTRVFSFGAYDADGIRENYDKHNISIISVDDSGNISFVIYGYMNRGAHEGMVGAGLYTYDCEANEVQERLFIPLDVPYEIVSQSYGRLAYVNDYNMFYCLLGDTLYSVDLESMEYRAEAENLNDDNCAVSGDGKIIAYPSTEEGKEKAVIEIFNMESGARYEIRAGLDEYIRAFDFIGSDFFYGYVKQADVHTRQDGTVVMPAYKMAAISQDQQIVKVYEQPGVYVEDTQVQGMRLNIYRLKKTEEGFVSTSMDQLLNKDENVTDEYISQGTITTEKWKKEVVLNILKTFNNSAKPTMRTSRAVLFADNLNIDLKWKNDNQTYYAYGYGRLDSSYTSAGAAVERANRLVGYVAGSDGRIYWRRLKNTSAKVSQINYEFHTNSMCSSLVALLRKGGYSWNLADVVNGRRSPMDVINEATQGNGLDLTGAGLEAVLFYVDNQIPVIGKNGKDSYVLIVGYDSTRVIYYDYAKRAEVSVDYGTGTAMFEAWNNTFYTYWK